MKAETMSGVSIRKLTELKSAPAEIVLDLYQISHRLCCMPFSHWKCFSLTESIRNLCSTPWVYSTYMLYRRIAAIVRTLNIYSCFFLGAIETCFVEFSLLKSSCSLGFRLLYCCCFWEIKRFTFVNLTFPHLRTNTQKTREASEFYDIFGPCHYW